MVLCRFVTAEWKHYEISGQKLHMQSIAAPLKNNLNEEAVWKTIGNDGSWYYCLTLLKYYQAI